MSLKYPYDRVDGYVQLSVDGLAFVPRFTREDKLRTPFLNFKRHWVAWRVLMKRMYGENYEPSTLSNFGTKQYQH
jgi:hypothetical protein